MQTRPLIFQKYHQHVKKFECRLLGPYLLNFLEVASISGRFWGLGGGLAVIVSWEGFFLDKREEPPTLIWMVSERSQKRIIKKGLSKGGRGSTEVAYLLLTQQPRVLIPSVPEIFSEEKLSMLLRLINRRKVDSGLKMLIEPI